MCWPLRGGRGTYTQKSLKIYRKKNILNMDLLVYVIWREAMKRYSPKREKVRSQKR
jgi:hypothetical protein